MWACQFLFIFKFYLFFISCLRSQIWISKHVTTKFFISIFGFRNMSQQNFLFHFWKWGRVNVFHFWNCNNFFVSSYLFFLILRAISNLDFETCRNKIFKLWACQFFSFLIFIFLLWAPIFVSMMSSLSYLFLIDRISKFFLSLFDVRHLEIWIWIWNWDDVRC